MVGSRRSLRITRGNLSGRTRTHAAREDSKRSLAIDPNIARRDGLRLVTAFHTQDKQTRPIRRDRRTLALSKPRFYCMNVGHRSEALTGPHPQRAAAALTFSDGCLRFLLLCLDDLVGFFQQFSHFSQEFSSVFRIKHFAHSSESVLKITADCIEGSLHALRKGGHKTM